MKMVESGYYAREHGRDSTVGVLDGVVEIHLLLVLDSLLAGADDGFVLYAAHFCELATIPIQSLLRIRTVEQSAEVDGSQL